jgi:hypothetical protein
MDGLSIPIISRPRHIDTGRLPIIGTDGNTMPFDHRFDVSIALTKIAAAGVKCSHGIGSRPGLNWQAGCARTKNELYSAMGRAEQL